MKILDFCYTGLLFTPPHAHAGISSVLLSREIAIRTLAPLSCLSGILVSVGGSPIRMEVVSSRVSAQRNFDDAPLQSCSGSRELGMYEYLSSVVGTSLRHYLSKYIAREDRY